MAVVFIFPAPLITARKNSSETSDVYKGQTFTPFDIQDTERYNFYVNKPVLPRVPT